VGELDNEMTYKEIMSICWNIKREKLKRFDS